MTRPLPRPAEDAEGFGREEVRVLAAAAGLSLADEDLAPVVEFLRNIRLGVLAFPASVRNDTTEVLAFRDPRWC